MLSTSPARMLDGAENVYGFSRAVTFENFCRLEISDFLAFVNFWQPLDLFFFSWRKFLTFENL